MQCLKENRDMDYLGLSVLPKNKDAQRFYSRHGLCEQMIIVECPIYIEQANY